MSERRSFPLGAILTGTTGRMLCRGGFGEFHEMVEFLTGGPVWTHEMGRKEFADLIARDLLRQHPDLPTEVEVDGATFPAWMDNAETQYGAAREIEPIPDYRRTKGPVETLAEMVGADPEPAP